MSASDDMRIRPNLARPPGPIPTMTEVQTAIGQLAKVLSQGGGMRAGTMDLCELVRRSPLYPGDAAASVVLSIEKRQGSAARPLWITPAGLALMPKESMRWSDELSDTPYGLPPEIGEPRRSRRR